MTWNTLSTWNSLGGVTTHNFSGGEQTASSTGAGSFTTYKSFSGGEQAAAIVGAGALHIIPVGWVETIFTVAWASLDPDSPFTDMVFSAIVAGDRCAYEFHPPEDANVDVSMSGDGVFTYANIAGNITVDYFIWDASDNTTGTIDTISVTYVPAVYNFSGGEQAVSATGAGSFTTYITFVFNGGEQTAASIGNGTFNSYTPFTFAGGEQAAQSVGAGIFNTYTTFGFGGGELSSPPVGASTFTVYVGFSFSGGEQASPITGTGSFNSYTTFDFGGGETTANSIGAGTFIIAQGISFGGGESTAGSVGSGTFIVLSTHVFGGGDQAASVIGLGTFTSGPELASVQALLDQIRLKLDDETGPTTVSDSDILTALNDAQNEFCIQTLCLLDTQSSISVLTGVKWIDLPEGTIWTAAASIGDDSLRIVTRHELDYGYFELGGTEESIRFSEWRTVTGTPVFLVADQGTEKARLVPIPDVDVTVELERYRVANTPITLTTAVEIAPQFHPALIIGALAYLFDIPEQEIYNKELSQTYKTRWENQIELAQQSLQTDLRATTRVLPLPEGVEFMQTTGNTF